MYSVFQRIGFRKKHVCDLKVKNEALLTNGTFRLHRICIFSNSDVAREYFNIMLLHFFSMLISLSILNCYRET